MKEILFYILLVITFLSAAKTHGRQYRLERELAGHWNVSFTEENHPWVERFWFRHRIIYWSIASLTAAGTTALRFIGAKFGAGLFGFMKAGIWGWVRFLAFLVPGSMIVAFVITGFMSGIRVAIKLAGSQEAPSREWLQAAIWGSIGWWLLTAFLLCTLIVLARKSFISPSSR